MTAKTCGSRLSHMKVATGKVVGGKVVVEGADLAEGASVTVLVRDNDETFELTAEQETELLRAISEAERGESMSADQLLKDLRSRAI